MAYDRTIERPLFLRNLGDCEIRSITFDVADVHILIADPFNQAHYSISFFGASYVSLQSNHMQNVIEDLKIFKDFEAARAYAAVERLLDKGLEEEGALVFYFEPLAGGELLVVCKGWSSRIVSESD